MRFAQWFRPPPARDEARQLYAHLVEQARDPAFYRVLGVPDSLDGRFEMVALHVFAALRRLKGEGAATGELAQALFDAMFADMDRSLREVGVSDLSVGKRVKEMARGLYGRIAAYEAGIAASPDAADGLEQALARNVYGTAAPPPRVALVALAHYLREASAGLQALPVARLVAGPSWPAIPAPGA